MYTNFRKIALSIGTLLIGLLVLMQTQAATQQTAYFYGPTKQRDSLWHIANATKPGQEISTQQMSLAIFKANPHAFKNNMNTLYTGVRLRIPTYEEVKTVTSDEAHQLVQQHNEQWLRPDILSVPILQKEVAALSEKINLVKEDTENRLKEIEADNSSLEQRVLAMADRVNVLVEDVAAHSMSINKLLDIMNEELQAIDESLTETIIGSIVVILFILITWLTFSLFKKPKVKQTANEESDDDLEDEYDFINSTEGIPAKIDLARAYIDMDNPTSALTILEEVISKGNQEQKQVAQTLIQKIRKIETA